VGCTGSSDPETQRGSAGETSLEGIKDKRAPEFLKSVLSCFSMLVGAETVTHLQMKVFPLTVRGCEEI